MESSASSASSAASSAADRSRSRDARVKDDLGMSNTSGRSDKMIVPLGDHATCCPRCKAVHRWALSEGFYVCECGLTVEKYGMAPALIAAISAMTAERDISMAQIENPFESLHATLVFCSRDWAVNEKDAWIWGIVVGWDWDDESMSKIRSQLGWSDETIARLTRLHKQFLFAKELYDQDRGESV